MDSFLAIPPSLADDFLFRHVHPFDPPGKTLLQFVDPETALRVDVFYAYGSEMSRTTPLPFSTGVTRLISIEDLAARTARLALHLANGIPTPSVYARDFVRLAEIVDPATFSESCNLLRKLIPARTGLLTPREYCKDVKQLCSRCRATSVFPFAQAESILSLLGYC